MDKVFDSSFRYGVSSFFRTPILVVVVFRVRLADSSLREFVSSSFQFNSSFYEFDSSPTTSVRRRLSFHRGVSSFRYGVSSFSFVHSDEVLIPYTLIHEVFIHNLLSTN